MVIIITLTKKMTNIPANSNLLELFKDDIALEFGSYYKTEIESHRALNLSVDIISNTTGAQFQFRYNYDTPTAWQDLIGDSVISIPKRSMVQIIPSVIVSGTITFKIE